MPNRDSRLFHQDGDDLGGRECPIFRSSGYIEFCKEHGVWQTLDRRMFAFVEKLYTYMFKTCHASQSRLLENFRHSVHKIPRKSELSVQSMFSGTLHGFSTIAERALRLL